MCSISNLKKETETSLQTIAVQIKAEMMNMDFKYLELLIFLN